MSPYLCQQKTLRDHKLQNKSWLINTGCRGFLFCLIVVLGMLFIWQTSSASTKGFAINDLQKKISDLEKESQKLDLEIAEQRSLKNIENRVSELGLVAADNVKYVTILGTAVARR
ncbi:MAG: Membrane-fusion protein [Candidatus Magasanikbacteria bacterium GW2011_GWC2_37_14]|uniref:Membrane-fusion protein n=1 Tax=Candidatus Magasanikbacteria bacterium GW2011_GWC2_37_14 TaxID=1619046 RepID=A0A0G0IT27_9BACT|nr:MAG: Membrane-fusion protein [Candidatus Magasanikbacteria bacterium GW2011_GWC2_37_14]